MQKEFVFCLWRQCWRLFHTHAATTGNAFPVATTGNAFPVAATGNVFPVAAAHVWSSLHTDCELNKQVPTLTKCAAVARIPCQPCTGARPLMGQDHGGSLKPGPHDDT